GSGFDSFVYVGRASRRFESAGLRLAGSFVTQRENDADLKVGGFEIEQRLFGNGRLSLQMPVSGGTLPASLDVTGTTTVEGPGEVPTSAAVRLDVDQPLGSRASVRFRFARTPSEFVNPFGQITVPGQQAVGGSLDTAITRST